MGGQLMNLAVIIVFGVILADMVKNSNGTNALFKGTATLWQTGINGMLGSTSNTASAA
jgi:hypothetical protein